MDVNDNTSSLNFYDKEADIEGLDVGEITLNFNKNYKTNFIYDESTGKYKYIRQGQPVIDEATGQEFDTDNLVVLFQKGVVAGPKGQEGQEGEGNNTENQDPGKVESQK